MYNGYSDVLKSYIAQIAKFCCCIYVGSLKNDVFGEFDTNLSNIQHKVKKNTVEMEKKSSNNSDVHCCFQIWKQY